MNKTTKISLLSGALMTVLSGPLFAQSAAVPNLAEKAAASYRDMARYPEWSQPLLTEVDPLISEREPARVSQGGGDGPKLTVWADASRYEAGDIVTLQAQLSSAVLPLNHDNWTVEAELMPSADAVIASLPLKDDGRGGDVTAGDGIYTGQLVISEDWQPELGTARNMGLKVAATDGKIRRGTMTGFLLSRPAAQLTGNYRDSLADGNLRIGAKVRVEKAGRFHLSGVLAGLDSLPVAFAQQSFELEPGEHWINLEFYGLILRELGATGPLQLRSVTLGTTGSMPNALGAVENNVLITAPYLPTQFTAKPFGRKDLLEMAGRLDGIVAE